MSNPIRLEAENFTLTNYRLESTGLASGGRLISLIGGNTNETGVARRTLDFSGSYDIYLGYLDETDGQANLGVSLGGNAIANLTLNQTSGTGGLDSPSFFRQQIGTNISVQAGQTLEILGRENASEHARVDYIEFVPRPRVPVSSPGTSAPVAISGELKQWHSIDLTFNGPQTGETDSNNPFLNYRLNVTFTNGRKTYVVPGYYAADGNAAETGATSGNKWRVHFAPDEVGTWTYTASFRQGTNVAVSLDPNAGTPTAFNGLSGNFTVQNTDKTGRDFRGKGRLEYTGEHYLQFAGTGEYFIKGGANSPENFLAYHEFDGTYDTGGKKNGLSPTRGIHHYAPHVNDWRVGDPTWQGGEGKGIIGALNYLASEGMNSVYFLTYNVDGGDGQDVWMWTTPTERQRFDVSKLAQWDTVFSHMDELGLMLHVLTQEKENDEVLSGGNLGLERQLYYRELIARFGYHLGMQWNLGEETDNTTEQLQSFAGYIRALDPYDRPIVVHTLPWEQRDVYDPLQGHSNFEGPSLQVSKNPDNTSHARTLEWLQKSAAAGRPWVVTVDEIGSAGNGVVPDAKDPTHDRVRKEDLWGNLMAGGAGVEWYFGYGHAHDDLDAEDWRSRDVMWDQTRYALEFFRRYLPFSQMRNNNGLTSATNDYVFAKEGEVYAVYLPTGGTTTIQLAPGNYAVRWYNPRTGGTLQLGTVTSLVGGGTVSIGQAPRDTTQDWAVLIKRLGVSTAGRADTAPELLAEEEFYVAPPVIAPEVPPVVLPSDGAIDTPVIPPVLPPEVPPVPSPEVVPPVVLPEVPPVLPPEVPPVPSPEVPPVVSPEVPPVVPPEVPPVPSPEVPPVVSPEVPPVVLSEVPPVVLPEVPPVVSPEVPPVVPPEVPPVVPPEVPPVPSPEVPPVVSPEAPPIVPPEVPPVVPPAPELPQEGVLGGLPKTTDDSPTLETINSPLSPDGVGSVTGEVAGPNGVNLLPHTEIWDELLTGGSGPDIPSPPTPTPSVTPLPDLTSLQPEVALGGLPVSPIGATSVDPLTAIGIVIPNDLTGGVG